MQNKNNMTYWSDWLAWALWIALLGYALIATLHTGRTVTGNYYNAALHWLQGLPLYSGSGGGFIYLPQSAIAYIPFAVMPFPVSEILWRLLNWALIFCLAQSCVALIDEPPKKKSYYFLIFTVFFLPVAFPSLRNGQMNLTVVIFMVSAMLFIMKERWGLVAFVLVFGFFAKPTVIVMLLLVAVLYPKTIKYMLLWAMAFLVLPFVTHFDWAYVVSQYKAAYNSLMATDRVGLDSPKEWAQLFNVLSLINVNPGHQLQLVLQIFFAAFTFVMLKIAQWRLRPRVFIIFLYTLSSCYLMLFNTRTENNSYIILGFATALLIAICWQSKRFFATFFIALVTLLIAFSHSLSKMVTIEDVSWVAPLATILLALVMLGYAVNLMFNHGDRIRHDT